jgi:hypothetical protein
VRVSLFLCEGIQAPSGRLITPSCVTPDLGTVTAYTKEGAVASKTRLPLAVLQVGGWGGWVGGWVGSCWGWGEWSAAGGCGGVGEGMTGCCGGKGVAILSPLPSR